MIGHGARIFYTHDLRAGDGMSGVVMFGVFDWKHRMFDHRIADVVDLIVGTKTKGVVTALGLGVDPFSFQAIKRCLFSIMRHQVLTQLWTDLDEQVAQMPNQGEVVENRTFALQNVVNYHQGKEAD
jgi:hypothetical protein